MSVTVEEIIYVAIQVDCVKKQAESLLREYLRDDVSGRSTYAHVSSLCQRCGLWIDLYNDSSSPPSQPRERSYRMYYGARAHDKAHLCRACVRHGLVECMRIQSLTEPHVIRAK